MEIIINNGLDGQGGRIRSSGGMAVNDAVPDKNAVPDKTCYRRSTYPRESQRMTHPLGTKRPFTLAVCTRCGFEPDSELMATLAETIRLCPHGVLVLTQCLLGQITCATRHATNGAMLLLQPCGVDRVPSTAAFWLGPVTKADTSVVCEWVATGIWDPARLPTHLRADKHLVRSSLHN